MSAWTHLLCEACWNQRNPDRRVAVRAAGASAAPCCSCGKPTDSGIYWRGNPRDFGCFGLGPMHEDDTPQAPRAAVDAGEAFDRVQREMLRLIRRELPAVNGLVLVLISQHGEELESAVIHGISPELARVADVGALLEKAARDYVEDAAKVRAARGDA